ncbi:Alpha/Beta hydrolase fold, partial [Rhodotorula toruloides]
TRAALIAHPFGRLGGRKEDHVVAAIAELLADEGYAVIRYDARGAGESEGIEGELLLCGYSFGSLAASACPPPSPPPSHPHARLTTSYLLISYPLSVIWALTLFRSGPFTTALRETVERGDERVLAIFGDRDQFSAVEKLRKWAGELETVAEGSGNKTWQAVEIEGADHFWLDRAPKIELLETVRAWVHR